MIGSRAARQAGARFDPGGAMAEQRISYVPVEKMDAGMREEMGRCQREGTPRPESSAIRAHVKTQRS